MAASTKTLLRRARIVTPERTIEDADLLIDSGAIARIVASSSTESIDAESEIDLRGQTLWPGFIDVHIHGAAGVDAMDARADDLCRVAEFLARHGVTSWLPTLVPAPAEQYERAVRAIEEAMKGQDGSLSAQARVLGVHYEGPFVNSEQCGALHHEYFRTFGSAADVDDLPTIASTASGSLHARGMRTQTNHLMTLAPEIEGGIELISELNRRGWIVSIGHTRANRDVLDKARNAGAHHLTHFMNAMTPLHHRDLGAVGWGLIQDDVTIDMIADGIHLDREVLRLIAKSKGVERVSLISDAIAATGQGDGDYKIWGENITVKDGRTSNDRGGIAGSVITMLDAVRMMLSLGFPETDAARMASQNPARLLGIDRECGSIQEGKRADLVALDENQNVRLTIIGGEIAHES
ncbi:MAG TPA: N-acetylglucosamine-6-phosphate deacetylase [Pyrinomonadaceae bacterium]|nr:N-acetylglucosamine-6-phosphate deacetylase [Pyrinomonadaceae bacterium]